MERTALPAGLVIRRVPLDALHLDGANARSHPERNMQAIAASLQRFGQAEPLVVHKRTGRVIGGNGRLAAMRELGWTECDIVEIDTDEATATALGLAFNRTAELAEWDQDALGRTLEALRADGALEGVGFDEGEIQALLREIAADQPPAEIEDEGPQDPPEVPVTRSGDLWLLGDHRLLCGDSTSAADVERVLGGEQAALWSSDPPFCVDYTGNDRPVSKDGKPSGKDWSHVYREIDIADLGEFLDQVFAATLPHLRHRAPIYCWHAHVQQPTIAATFERHGLLLHQVLVWVKPSAVFGHSFYRWRHEPCAFGWKKGDKPEHGTGQLDTVWEADWDGKARFTTFHPTSKPTRLFEIPLEQHTLPGDLVLEPFSGSGSQIIAGEKLRRRVAAIELQPAFVDGTLARWEKATGREARLGGTGQTLAEVRAERAEEAA